MKKSIIKRRKRVVPAMQEHNLNVSQVTSFPVLASPDPSHQENMEDAHQHRESSVPDPGQTGFDESERTVQEDEVMQEEQPPPIGVDFTGYKLDQHGKASLDRQQRTSIARMSSPSTTPALPPAHLSVGTMPPTNARKRSYSNTDREDPSPSTPESARTNRLSSISSLLNPAQQHSATSDEMPIDPSLSQVPQFAKQHRHSTPYHHLQQPQLAAPSPDGRSKSLGSGDPGGWDKMERRSRLQREVSFLRDTLRAKERELEELDGEL